MIYKQIVLIRAYLCVPLCILKPIAVHVSISLSIIYFSHQFMIKMEFKS